jgi:hypothetical protein
LTSFPTESPRSSSYSHWLSPLLPLISFGSGLRVLERRARISDHCQTAKALGRTSLKALLTGTDEVIK